MVVMIVIMPKLITGPMLMTVFVVVAVVVVDASKPPQQPQTDCQNDHRRCQRQPGIDPFRAKSRGRQRGDQTQNPHSQGVGDSDAQPERDRGARTRLTANQIGRHQRLSMARRQGVQPSESNCAKYRQQSAPGHQRTSPLDQSWIRASGLARGRSGRRRW